MVLKKFLLLPPSYQLARIARHTCEGATEPCKPVALKSLLQPVLQQRKQEVSVNLARAVELKEAKAGFLLLEHFPEGNHKSDAAALRRFGGWVERRETQGLSITTFHHHYLGGGTDSPALGYNLLLASTPPLFLRAGENLLRPWLSVA